MKSIFNFIFFFLFSLLSINVNFANAEEINSQLIPFDTDEIIINLEIGNQALKNGDYNLAISSYLRTLMLNTKCFEAAYNLAYVYQLKNDFKNAEKYFNIAISIDNKRYEPYLNLGVIFYLNKEYDKAIKIFKKVLEISPNNFDAKFNLAIIEIEKQNYNSAILILNDLLKFENQNKSTSQNLFTIKLKLALCNILINNFNEALKYLDFNSNDTLEEIEKLYYLGCIYYKTNKLGQANEAFDNALNLAKNSSNLQITETLTEKINNFKKIGKVGRIKE